MVLPQPAMASDFQIVPPAVSGAAERYQRFKEIEKQHLALMAQHNLLDEWSEDVRATVLLARERVQEARAAREAFRLQVKEFVVALRTAGESLPTTLRHTRSMLQLLERSGAVTPDEGWLEAEVLEWAIEEFEA